MSTDLQAKYNALLKMFNGEQPLGLPQEVMNSISRDLAEARNEKAKRNAEALRVSIEKQSLAHDVLGNSPLRAHSRTHALREDIKEAITELSK